MPLRTRPYGDSPGRRQTAKTSARTTADGISQSAGVSSSLPNGRSPSTPVMPMTPPRASKVAKTPMIPSENADVIRMRNSWASPRAISPITTPSAVAISTAAASEAR
jgi:hypothetical protein